MSIVLGLPVYFHHGPFQAQLDSARLAKIIQPAVVVIEGRTQGGGGSVGIGFLVNPSN